jgi:hypothetical protein
MKTIKNLLSIFVIITSLTFVSCENEPIDPSLIGTNASGNGNGGNGTGGGNGSGGSGGGTGGGTSTGDYWPAAINNSWSFSNNGAPSETMKMISTSNVSGLAYHDFDNIFGQGAQVSGNAAMKLRKNSGDYYIKIEATSLDIGGGMSATQTPFEFLVLKDYLAVNQTWNGTYTQTTSYTGGGISIPAATSTSNYVGTILGTNLTETVDGETFTNVIKLKIVQSITITGMPGTTTIETIYWFSKNVGPIKSQTISNGSTTTSILTDYVLN